MPPKKQKTSSAGIVQGTKKKGGSYWLPDELFQAIFNYLPWSSVKCCRLVSRKWKCLVDSPEVLNCAALNIVHPETDIEERFGSQMIDKVGKVNLKQAINSDKDGLVEQFSSFLNKNGAKAKLAEMKMKMDFTSFLPLSTSPYLVLSLGREQTTSSFHVSSIHLDAKKISVKGSVVGKMVLIEGILDKKVRTESLVWDNFDLIDYDYDEHGENGESVDWQEHREEADGPEFFIKPLVKAVLMCKEITLCNINQVRMGAAGPWFPKIMNNIFTAIANNPNPILKKLVLNLDPDCEIGAGSHLYLNKEGLDPNIFAEAICKLEYVSFGNVAVQPDLEEAMFKKMKSTPIKVLTMKSLQISYVTTKPQILAYVAPKLVNLHLHMGDWKMYCSSDYDQCAQAKAILDRIHSAKRFQLETLEIDLHERYPRSKWCYPATKMEEIKAKIKKIEISDGTLSWNPEEEEENNCTLQ